MVHCSEFDLDELMSRAKNAGLEIDKEHMEEVLNERPEIGLLRDRFGRTLSHVLSNRGEISPKEAHALPGSEIQDLNGVTSIERAQITSAMDLADAVA